MPEDHDLKLSKISRVSLSLEDIVLGRFLLPLQIASASAGAFKVHCHVAERPLSLCCSDRIILR